MKIEIKEIKTGTPEYAKETELRARILREPLGLKFSPEDLADDARDLHLGAFLGDQLVGCLLLRTVQNSILKMRQVAVDTQIQGAGIGKTLVSASEEWARKLDATEIQLHARDTAVPFYLKLGYELFGEPFMEVGIAHRRMRKVLASTDGRTKIFVDGNCVVCDFEISHYKRIAPELFEIIDISDPDFRAAAHGLTIEAVNKNLHIQTSKGEIRAGVEAFMHIWSRIPRYHFASRLVGFPGFHLLAKIGYAFFVEIRPWLPRKK